MPRRYPKEFFEQRKRVLVRDGYRCIVCHRGPQENKQEEYWQSYGLEVYKVSVDLTSRVDAHHVAYWVMDLAGHYTDETLPDEMVVTLCDSCHGKAGTCSKESPFHKIIENYVRALLAMKFSNETPVGVV
jgi:hypothetical protein